MKITANIIAVTNIKEKRMEEEGRTKMLSVIKASEKRWRENIIPF